MEDLGYNIKVDASMIICGLDYGSRTYLYENDDESESFIKNREFAEVAGMAQSV
jgi:hypothetical protein